MITLIHKQIIAMGGGGGIMLAVLLIRAESIIGNNYKNLTIKALQLNRIVNPCHAE